VAVLAVAVLGAVLLMRSAFRGSSPRPQDNAGPRLRAKPKRRADPIPRKPLGAWLWFALLPLLAILLGKLRTQTHFLGDGIVWLANLTSGQFPRFSEPLAGETWHAYVAALHAIGIRADEGALAGLPVICGVAAAALMWLLARELSADPRARWFAALLLLTLGMGQLYFGYIESYPIAAVFVLTYLWAGARAANSARFDALPGIALALAIAGHIISALLVPSYVWLVTRARTSFPRKAFLLIIPALLTAGLFAWLRFGVEDLLRPFRTVEAALRGGTGGFGFAARGLLSARHWIDLLNVLFLVAAVPVLLVVTRLVPSGPKSKEPGDSVNAPPTRPFLALAALPGLVATPFLVVPSSPAQDWDLLAIVLLPAAVAAVAAGLTTARLLPMPARTGLLMIGAAGLLAFVLVNANPSAGINRFEALLGGEAVLGGHERAYGNEKLATYWSDRGNFERALVHARRAAEAEPTNPRYWVKTAGALISLGRYDEAVPPLEEALRRAPGRPDASYNLGIAYMTSKRFDDAVRAFRVAVAGDGNRPEYRHNLGLALDASGRRDSAKVVWTEVLERWPGYPLTVRSMARRFGAGGANDTTSLEGN